MSKTKFVRTRAISKLLRLRKRIRIVPGGTSAGKTYGIIPILIDKASRRADLEISIVSESVPHLRRGAMKDFLKIMRDTGRFNPESWNKTMLTYTFGNGSFIEFFSADQESKVRGPRRNILYVNECNNLSFDTYHQLAIRTDELIYLDFNPSHEFWVHTELGADPDAEWLTLTYQDNQALPATIVREIEKARDKGFHNPRLDPSRLFAAENIANHYWANWWKVYGLGLKGKLEGVIFQDWKQIKTIPPGARLLGRGMDFGFTNDPTTLVELWQWNKTVIYHQVIYETGLLNSAIAAKVKALNNYRSPIYADNAAPKDIAELKSYGLNIQAVDATKGQGEIMFGINLMLEQDIYITQESLDLISEFRKYMYAKDKSGKLLNQPIDEHNHGIDAARYITISKLRRRPNGIRIRANRS